MHLLGHVAFRWRNVGTWNTHRSIVAFALLLLLPVVWLLPALASLALVAGLLSGLVCHERWRGSDRLGTWCVTTRHHLPEQHQP